jgi:hypothetical protein
MVKVADYLERHALGGGEQRHDSNLAPIGRWRKMPATEPQHLGSRISRPHAGSGLNKAALDPALAPAISELYA